jgi:hypothetical protein
MSVQSFAIQMASAKTQTQSKWHPQKLKHNPNGIRKNSNSPNGVIMAVFFDIFYSHRDLVITSNEIDFGEDRFSRQTGGEVLNVRKRVSVRYCRVV